MYQLMSGPLAQSLSKTSNVESWYLILICVGYRCFSDKTSTPVWPVEQPNLYICIIMFYNVFSLPFMVRVTIYFFYAPVFKSYLVGCFNKKQTSLLTVDLYILNEAFTSNHTSVHFII